MQVKVFRAFVVSFTGRHGIEKWMQIDGKPEVDNKNFFYTFEDAHEALVKNFATWLESQNNRLHNLKTLKTEKVFDAHEIPASSGRCFVEG